MSSSSSLPLSINLIKCPHLNSYASKFNAHVKNVRADGQKYANLLNDTDVVLSDVVRGRLGTKSNGLHAYVRAGPREENFFDPKKTVAAIVTCGGLCPGLNVVIYHLYKTLVDVYSVSKVFAIRGGWQGFYNTKSLHIMTTKDTKGIQKLGGTILGTSRGGFDEEKITNVLEDNAINLLFVIGGDGTHRGAEKLFQRSKQRGYPLSVIGIPKTIDNDIGLIDRSFGFSTSIDEAVRVIRSARTEASSNVPNGIGIVKLMGRHAGFIAAHATLASADVDLCLIPEISLNLNQCLEHVREVLRKNGNAVIVLAEGAGADLLLKDVDSQRTQTDASGKQPELPPIGPWFVKCLKEFLRSNKIPGGAIKYIDPSYIIRSVPANSSDSLLCMMLAQNAVHAAMAGYTGCSVGLCNNRLVLLPISKIVESSPRGVNPRGRTLERIISVTHQPKP
jgi:6-phosphofructokinase 1